MHSPDRLARKYAYQVLLLEELGRCGADVVFLNHAVSDNPEEQLLLQVQGMMAEYERARIAERCRRGKLHAARHGSVNVLGHAPYGYRYLSARVTGGHAAYEIVLEQARVVRQIFAWVGRDRVSIREVCRRLQNQGICTAMGRSWWDPGGPTRVNTSSRAGGLECEPLKADCLGAACGGGQSNILIWSSRRSSCSCRWMYSRIAFSSRPTVDTKYPRAQKCSPVKSLCPPPTVRAM